MTLTPEDLKYVPELPMQLPKVWDCFKNPCYDAETWTVRKKEPFTTIHVKNQAEAGYLAERLNMAEHSYTLLTALITSRKRVEELEAKVSLLQNVLKGAPHTFNCDVHLVKLPAPLCHCYKSGVAYKEAMEVTDDL